MTEEQIKQLAKEEFIKNLKQNLDSTLIYTYISGLEKENQRLNNITKEFKMYLIEKIEYMKYHSIERMVAYDDSLAKFKDLEGENKNE